jgi:two-component system, NarL family, response regulator DevR
LEKQRILVVEDDVRFSEVLQQAMGHALAAELLDVAFVGAGSISEARARLREGGLDAALIDVRLPDGDGLDLVEEINDGGVGSPMPTLVLTAYLDPKVAIRAIDAGAQGAFSKVASVPQTVEAIIRLIESGSSEA